MGYYVEDIHENTYTLTNSDNMWDFIDIIADYDTYDNNSGLPEYSKEHYEFPYSQIEEFTEAEQNQIRLDIENFKIETKK